jgi:hypothetical protein
VDIDTRATPRSFDRQSKEFDTMSIPILTQRLKEKTTGTAHVKDRSSFRKGVMQHLPRHAKIFAVFHTVFGDALQITLG